MDFYIVNISASVMIIITFFIRKFAKYKVPHIVFIFLWLAIGVRLLLPISVDASSSFFNWRIISQPSTDISIIHDEQEVLIKERDSITSLEEIPNHSVKSIISHIIIAGIVVVGGFFVIQYLRAKRDIKHLVPLGECNRIQAMIEEQNLPVNIKVMLSNDMKSPATWGMVRPIIIFPMDFDFGNESYLNLVLLHECGHIKYFHSLLKMLSMLIVSLYWYNPFVWVMFCYLDRDMEISADRYVLKRMNEDYRATYARSLLSAASAVKQVPIFYHNYKKNFVKERIEAIMYFKKLTVGAAIVAMLIPASVVSVFATTGTVLDDSALSEVQVTVYEEEVDLTETAEDVYLELEWEDIKEYIVSSRERGNTYTIEDYKYVTYGEIPPNTIYISIQYKGKTYAGSITRENYVYNAQKDKYTGYYNGKVYRQ